MGEIVISEVKRTELNNSDGSPVTSMSSFSFLVKGQRVTFNHGVLTSTAQIDELHVNDVLVVPNRARTRARKPKSE